MTKSAEQIMCMVDQVTDALNSNNYNDLFVMNLMTLATDLQAVGPQVEAVYNDQLNRAFNALRKSSFSNKLQVLPRKLILFLIEMRAQNWVVTDSVARYYRSDIHGASITAASQDYLMPPEMSSVPAPSLPSATPLAPPLLAPGETINTSGKFAKPTKIPGKNYYKDEVVIRNSDSGKVNPGAKERLVQITGQDEAHINYARQLMGDTIRRNASPVPFRGDQPDLERVGGSSSSVNSSASDESARPQGYQRVRLHHSLSTNDASVGDYKYTVMVGGNSVKITGSNYTLVMKSKLALDKFFENEPQQLDCSEFFTSYDEDYPPTTSAPETPKMDLTPLIYPAPAMTEYQEIVRHASPVATAPPNRLVSYSREQLCQCAHARICAKEPDNFDKICPASLRKPYESFDPEAYFNKFLEMDSSASVISATEIESLDAD